MSKSIFTFTFTIFIFTILITTATAQINNCTNDVSGGGYVPYCGNLTIYGDSFEFNCTCYTITHFRNPVAQIEVQPQQPGVAFSFWQLTVGVGVSVNYSVGVLNGSSSQWNNVSATDITKTTASSGILQLEDQPALITYDVTALDLSSPTSHTNAENVTFHFNAMWAPCNTRYTPQVQLPSNLRPGLNQATITWQSPVINSPVQKFLGFDVLLANQPNETFNLMTSVNGNQSFAVINVVRDCQQQRLRVWTFSVFPNTTRGPYCLQAYPDSAFYVRQAPSQPGMPVVDANSLSATKVVASWPASQDDGGCEVAYTVSVMNRSSNLSYVVTESTSATFKFSDNPLQSNVVYTLVVTANSVVGSSSSSVSFQISGHSNKEKNNTVLIIVACAVSGVSIIGFVLYFTLRRMRKGDYTTLH